MATLVKYENPLPSGFFNPAHCSLWIHKNNKIYRRKRTTKIHARIWGAEAWSIQERGYYNAETGIVMSYAPITPDLSRKLAKKFANALFYKEGY